MCIPHARASIGLHSCGQHVFGAVLEEVPYLDGLILLKMNDANDVPEIGAQMQQESQQKWVEKDEGISTKTTRDQGR